jgi:hypothetical protein
MYDKTNASHKAVKQIAETAEQTGHGVVNTSLHPAEQKQNVRQAAQHNRDLARIEKLHQSGFKK